MSTASLCIWCGKLSEYVTAKSLILNAIEAGLVTLNFMWQTSACCGKPPGHLCTTDVPAHAFKAGLQGAARVLAHHSGNF